MLNAVVLYSYWYAVFLKKQDFNRAVITMAQESERSDWLRGP